MIGMLNETDCAGIFLRAVGVFNRGVSGRDIVSFSLDNTLGDCRISELYFMN